MYAEQLSNLFSKLTIGNKTLNKELFVTNLKHFEELLLGVDTNQVDLIVLPEMFHTGFTMSAEALAEEMNNSIGIKWLQSMAKNKNAGIYTSLIIKEDHSFFNRGVFVYPSGEIKTYDKKSEDLYIQNNTMHLINVKLVYLRTRF